MRSIAVVHLVWGPLGCAPLREFLRSYHSHPAGAEHELVVLFNGVSSAERAALEATLEGAEHRLLTLAEPVQDLVAYRQAAERLEHDRVCFLNSYTEILTPDWLAKLGDALDQPRTGMVGATASWASVHSGVLHSLFIPNPYSGVFPEKRVAREQFHAIELEHSGADPAAATPSPRSLIAKGWATLKTFPSMPEQLLRFEGFPARHIRTNAFMIDRVRFIGLRLGRVRRKLDAYVLESGRTSFTRQVQRLGLSALVVDRDGCFYEPERWPLSRTFWQADQEGLMIADNQTRSYANGGFDRRRVLSTFAWGPQAEPRLPASVPDS
jgi:hypothetical protein